MNDDPLALSALEGIFESLVGKILSFAAIILFFMLVSGGFKYLTSGGDPKALESAKKTLTYAIGGIVLIVLSLAFLNVIQDLTGAPVTDFKIVQ